MSGKNNMINICVDKYVDGEMSGRIYHCYDQKPWEFSSVIRMLSFMEIFFDKLSFPQASTKTRTFIKREHSTEDKLDKVTSTEAVKQQRGEKGTFLVSVKYRQNSSWQGEVKWMEQETNWQFISALELLKVISNILES